MENESSNSPPKKQRVKISKKKLRESLMASEIIPGAPKRKKLRIKRLIRKQNGDLTLRDTTFLNETKNSILTSTCESKNLSPSQANESQVSKVDYKFTRNKNADSFRPDFGDGPTGFDGVAGSQFPQLRLDPGQMNFVKKKKKRGEAGGDEIGVERVYEYEKGGNRDMGDVKSFAQMIDEDIRKNWKKEDQSEVTKLAKNNDEPELVEFF